MVDVYNKAPLYYKIAEKLEELIDNKTYLPGDQIPSERELCEIYSVSRMTIRLAIDELKRLGKVEKVQGKGTYVVNSSIVQNLKNVYSFSKEMDKQGKVSSTKILKKEVIENTAKIANRLDISISDKIIYLERLRLAENVAVMVEKTWFPYKKYSFLMDIDFNENGLYKTLEEKYNIVIDSAIETFKATELNPYECKLLHCPKNQFGLLVKRTSYSNGEIVSYSTIVSKGDTFEFTIKLQNK